MANHRNLRLRIARRRVLALGMTLALLFPVYGGAEVSGPRMALSETSFHFGTVMEDQALSHTFIIRNVGTAPLQIMAVHTDCDCMVSKYPRTIAPGGQGEITLTIKPFSVRQRFKKAAMVFSNNSGSPQLFLTLTGESLPM